MRRRVGAGSSGEVFEAFDPRLDRSVALKLLRGDRHRGADREAVQQRMIREARALAQLSHPNVVTVFDAGIVDDRVYIAMELVAGQSLRQWLHARARPWREVIDLHVQAGRGLAAAHAAGLVHRDVKPANVLIGDDGRVRVVDFGLVAERGAREPTLSSPTPAVAGSSMSSLTATGLHVGTRGYMAPEQALGGLASPAADQFGFCVALWEALHGERPFAADEPVAMAREVLAGRVRSSPSARGVPRALQAALRRGLCADPSDRWPSMAPLLARLVALRRRRPGRWIAVVGVVGMIAVTGGVMAQAGRDESGSSGCTAPQLEVWSGQVARRMRQRFMSQAPEFASASWAFTRARIDGAAEQWRRTHGTVCREHTQGRLSDQRFDQAMDCLRGRRHELGAALEVLAQADAEVVRHAHEVVGGLSSAEACKDPPATGYLAPAEDLRSQLARVATVRRAGKYAKALAGSEEVMQSARSREDSSALAVARVEQGQALADLGRFSAARAVLEDGYFIAREAGHEQATLEAATRLTELWGVTASDREQGLRWAQHGWASLGRHPSTRGRARLLEHQARVRSSAGRSTQARADAERSLALWEAELDPADPGAAGALEVMATTLSRAGLHEQAAHYIRRAHEVRERTLGPEHPETSMTLTFLASIEDDRGHSERAEARLWEALERLERAVGPEHPYVATVLANLAVTMLRVQDNTRAEPLLLRAQAILQEHEEGAVQAMVLHNLGVIAALDGRMARARGLLERGREILMRTRGVDHPRVGQALQNLGAMAKGQGQLEQAERHYRDAMEIFLRRLGPDHPWVAHLFANQARLAQQQGKLGPALEHAQRALRLRERRLGDDHPQTMASRALVEQVQQAAGAPADVVPPALR